MQVRRILAIAGISILPFPAIAREPLSNIKPASVQAQSLSIVENKGQIADQYGKQRGDIQFKIAAAQGLSIFVGNGQVHYQWSDNSKVKSQKSKEEPLDDVLTTYRLDVELLGADIHAPVQTEQQQAYYEHYITSGLDEKGVIANAYNKITYKNIYPAIDWVLYVKNGGLKYDFIVHPGGNVQDIQIKYKGASNSTLNADGSMTVTTPMGSIKEDAPYAYMNETGKTVTSAFDLKNNILSFSTDRVTAADNGTLIIDPALQWATYYGGTGDEKCLATCYDGSGYVYIAGYTNSNTNIATSGSFQSTYSIGHDGFIAKFNGSGVRQWATYYGGNGQDEIWGANCDGSGYLYVTGWTSSTNVIASTGAYQTTNGGAPNDAFLAKFDGSGNRQWGTYYGGNNTAQIYGYAVACDGSGNVFFTGYTNSTSAIASTGAYQTSLAGGYDVFLAKFNSSGARQWATYYGGSGDEGGRGVTCDGTSGNVYITGYTSSTSSIATSSAYQSSNSGGTNDAFLAKFNSTGSLQWGTYYGGSGDDVGFAVTYDGTGYLYFAGQTSSTSGIASSGAYQTSNGGDYDAFLAKFNTSGSRSWGTYFGGSDSDYAYGVAVASGGGIYIAGPTASSSNIAVAGAYQTTIGGTQDAYLAKFNNAGQRLWATYFGGPDAEQGYGVTCDGADNVYLCGATHSTGNMATSGAYQTSFGGGAHDGFLVKFKADTTVYCVQPFTDTLKCAGDTINIHYTVNFPFNSGNTFSVQLSNALGSFVTPVTIGSLSATAAGTIACTIPAGTTTGTGYRVRIISTTPIDTSVDDGINIHIYRLPAPSSTNNSPICMGDTLKITVSDSVSSVSYSWTGPNSFTSTSQNISKPNMAFADSGNYIVTLTYGACTLKDTLHATVKPLPAKPTAGSNSPVCTNGTLNLTASTTTTGVTWSWTGPNSFTSTVQNPNISPLLLIDSGYYIVKATLNGCSSKDTTHVSVAGGPAPATITNNSPICKGDTLKLTSSSVTVGVSYSWTGPNSYTSTSQNITKPNATYTDSGTYYLTVSINGCNLYDTLHVTIKPLPATPTMSSNSPVCANSSLNLTSSSTTAGVTYSWTGPNSFTSITQNPVINPVLLIDSGYYIVKAILNGCSSADTMHVTVKVTPALPTTTNNTPICAGDTLKLTSSSITAGVSYGWTGPNSYSSSTQNVTIANAGTLNSGNYYLTVSLNGCSVHDTISAIVHPLPAVPTMGSNSPVCSNTSLNLSSNSTTLGVTYSWTGPNSFISSLQNPVVNPALLVDSGYYVVHASLNGCSSVDSIHVVIVAGPDSVYYNNNTPICTGDNLLINSGSASAGATYNWTGPNSFISSTSSFTISNTTLANAGSYYLTVSVNGCNVHDTVHAIINQTPAVPTVGSNSSVCVASNLSLNASSTTAGVTYSWTGPNSFTAITQNPIITNVTAVNAGNYIVTASLNGCSSKDSTTVTINPRPAGPTANSNTPLCAGDTLKLTGNCTTVGVSYQWSGPGSYISTLQNPKLPNVVVSNAGTYILNVSLNGCSNTANTVVTINPMLSAPVVHIVASPGDTVCTGATITFTATVTSAVNPTYQWRVNGVNVGGATNPSYITAGLNNLDIVSCMVVSNAPCQPANSSVSNAITMHIGSLPAPVVTVTYYPPLYTQGTAVTFFGHVPMGSNGLSYQWTKNGINISGANVSFYTTTNVSAGDTICLIVTSNVPCTIPAKVCVELSTGIEPLSGLENSIVVYPNPSNGSFTIKAGIDHKVDIAVVNTLGQEVYRQSAEPVNNLLEKQIDLDVANGLYMIRIADEKESKNVPLIIRK